MSKMIMVLWRDASSITTEERTAVSKEVPDAEFHSFYPKTALEHVENCRQHHPVAVLLPEEGFFSLAMRHAPHVIMGDARKGRRRLYRITKEKAEVDGVAPAIAPMRVFSRKLAYYNKRD